jgi:hypothetical protein
VLPFRSLTTGALIANCVYLRLWVENVGNATARYVEVYARELRQRRADRKFKRVEPFPPMNPKWVHLPGFAPPMYFPMIAPNMGKHCDIGHIVDPAQRTQPGLSEENPALGLTNQETSLTFDLITAPNHKGHIIGPGEYELDILVAADNAAPVAHAVEITLKGPWSADETTMIRNFVGITVR